MDFSGAGNRRCHPTSESVNFLPRWGAWTVDRVRGYAKN